MFPSVQGPGLLFSLVPMMMVFLFTVFFIILIVKAVSGVRNWSKNNASPVLSVAAKVVGKREDVRSYANAAGPNQPMTPASSTSYAATFEVESGDRMEFRLQGQEYGLLAEGDAGKLTFQGTRFLGFERMGTAPPSGN